jgi:cation transport regulator ChaC
VTLVEADGDCEGVAFLIDAGFVDATLARLDHREQNGYRRTLVPIEFDDATGATALAWVAATGNHAFLGPAPRAEIAAQIRRSRGPSGANADYLFELANALRALDVDDPHVFDLEAAVREENG